MACPVSGHMSETQRMGNSRRKEFPSRLWNEQNGYELMLKDFKKLH